MFNTVAVSVIPIVRRKARWASAEVIASQNGAKPEANAPRTSANVGVRIKSANQPSTAAVSNRRLQAPRRTWVCAL